jgi:chromate transporter
MTSDRDRPSMSIEPSEEIPAQTQSVSIAELATTFLRLGTVAFGGPAAHIAMMDDEVVTRRQWMSRETLIDLMGITNLLPGPNSTELAIHIGYEKGGWPGLLIAGSCFILPAMILVWVLAALYVHLQSLPQLEWLLYGIKPVIIAVVLQALWKLGRKAAKNTITTFVGLGTVAAYFMGLNEILVLLVAGVLVMVIQNTLPRGANWMGSFAPVTLLSSPVTGLSLGWTGVFLFFLKIGCVLYGSGYVLLAFLQRDLVEQHHWLTSQQLLDAVAIGQITPGPILTTATFVGYLLAGNAGAIAATIGIFLPAFLLVGLVNPWVPKLRKSPGAGSFLDGVNAASLGLMMGVTYTLSRAAVVDRLTLFIAGLSAIAVLRFRMHPVWLILGGGCLSFLFHLGGWIQS